METKALGVAITASLAMAVAGCATSPPPSGPAMLSDFGCETRCDGSTPRSPVLEVHWTNTGTNQLRLDATVFASGFDRGWLRRMDMTDGTLVSIPSIPPAVKPAPFSRFEALPRSGASYQLDLYDVDPATHYFLRWLDAGGTEVGAHECVPMVCVYDQVGRQGPK